MARAIGSSRTTDPDHAMGDYQWSPTNTPRLVIIREIDFEIVPGTATTDWEDSLVFYYSQHTDDQRITNRADFYRILRDVCKRNYVFGGGRSEPKGEYDTKLSLDSQDSLSYVIFKLAPRRWQFARKGRPLRIGTDGRDAQAYYDAHRVDPAGNEDKGDNPNNIKNGCKVAYFISNGPKALAHGSYPHAFNIYVDLLFGTGYYMPIRLDPDVRHPGGSSE